MGLVAPLVDGPPTGKLPLDRLVRSRDFWLFCFQLSPWNRGWGLNILVKGSVGNLVSRVFLFKGAHGTQGPLHEADLTVFSGRTHPTSLHIGLLALELHAWGPS